MKYLGIDYGSKRIGLAVSDSESKIAFPKEVLVNEGSKTVTDIATVCQKESVGAIVLGQSLDYKGRDNPIQADIANFKLQIQSLSKLPVHYQSETLTSALAARNTEKKNLDASAAALILQSYLDKL